MSDLNFKNKDKRGVTLIELMVVIVIFMILTGITIFSYGKFNSSMSIQNLADDVSLAIRRAQGYAIGVKNYGSGFASGYGVHFSSNGTNISNLYRGSAKSFVLFAALDSDNFYKDAGTCVAPPTSTNECLEILSVTTADQISLISYTDSGVQTDLTANDSLDIIFRRPTPEPYFCYRPNSATNLSVGCAQDKNISSIRIKIISPNNLTSYRVITVSNNGQISVSNI